MWKWPPEVFHGIETDICGIPLLNIPLLKGLDFFQGVGINEGKTSIFNIAMAPFTYSSNHYVNSL